ncbi:hypothetical protein MIND_00781300 [Mycena indigotica]|uniref:Peptidase A1 domain-containing protein n=1 Tax=Mycena indigotica TaxID=2126181 RepID=A0A8H6SNK4_9AGAR|nr:uncharacterized protein MIND_00781300 [Mycena indigotica]KAF7302145.1 hypothetical protein MIND_00781300 [Mycena indigotica]
MEPDRREAPKATESSGLHLIPIYPFSWDIFMRMAEHAAIDVERRGITRPLESKAWGIFYNPELRRAAFYPPTSNAYMRVYGCQKPSDGEGTTGVARRPQEHRTEQRPRLPLQDVREQHPHAVPRMFTVTTIVHSDLDDDLSRLRRRSDDGAGLHYASAHSSDSGPVAANQRLKLLVDIACPVTWMYAPEAKTLVIPTESSDTAGLLDKPVPRRQRATYYTGSATKVSETVQEVRDRDKFGVRLQLHRGSMCLMKEDDSDVFQIDNFKFALCNAATQEKSLEAMDGILGLSSRPMRFDGTESSDLFVQKYSENKGGRQIPSFKISLGDDESDSWLIIDSNASDQSIQHIVPHFEWSDWIPAIDNSAYNWAFNVVGLTIDSVLHEIPPTAFIIDTATVFTYLPDTLYFALIGAARAEVHETGQVCCKDSPLLSSTLKSKSLHLNLEGGGLVDLGGLDRFLMRRTFERGTRDLSFRSGNILRPASTEPALVPPEPRQFFVLGNLLLQHLVVDFQYPDAAASSGRIRMAVKK